MVIYGEYLFLENLIVGLMLLCLTGRLAGVEMQRWRLGIASVLSGLCSFCIFIELHPLLALLVRGLTGVMLTAIALGREDLVKKTGLFLLLTFLSGGAVMAFFLWQGVPSLSANGFLYTGAITYGGLLIFGGLAFGLCWWLVRQTRRQRRIDAVSGTAQLELDGKMYTLRAMVDSGNSLREPITGKPVILLDEKGSACVPFTATDYPERTTLIPYRAVGVENGLLEGVRLDRLIFAGRTVSGVVLARYTGKFEGFEVLLHRDILEGGLLKNG